MSPGATCTNYLCLSLLIRPTVRLLPGVISLLAAREVCLGDLGAAVVHRVLGARAKRIFLVVWLSNPNVPLVLPIQFSWQALGVLDRPLLLQNAARRSSRIMHFSSAQQLGGAS
jgi:hypothetical protein